MHPSLEITMNEQAANQEVDVLREELRLLREEMADLKNNAPNATHAGAAQDAAQRDFAKELQDELRYTLNKAREKGDEVLDQARAQGEKAVDQIGKQIGERPLLSLLLVFFVGLIVAKFLERR
jgi:ElaB/YqjD/DUF883 family membrane-anchored ribosome-binding protein